MKLAVAQDVVHWEAAAAAAAAVARWADEASIKVNIAVVDSGGDLAAFLRMPGAFLHSIEIAIDKAYTAAGFGLPTGSGPRPWRRIHRPSDRALRRARAWCVSAAACR